jgi:hypothetical protein
VPLLFAEATREAPVFTMDRETLLDIVASGDAAPPDLPLPPLPFESIIIETNPVNMAFADGSLLVLMGECIAIVEDQERHLGAWDFVHCPPGTAHTFVGSGGGPCLLLCAGNRDLNDETFWRIYKRSDLALRYGASVERDTSSGAEANAPWRDRWRVERPETWGELPWSSAS